VIDSMYYPIMASLIEKRKKGRPYLYWVRSARVEGKPRIVEQVYLGPKERVLEEIKQAYSRGQTQGPSPLRQIQVKEFGASAWLWHWAQKLGLRSEEHTSELQSRENLVCRLLLEKKNKTNVQSSQLGSDCTGDF